MALSATGFAMIAKAIPLEPNNGLEESSEQDIDDCLSTQSKENKHDEEIVRGSVSSDA
jgi:hypothetical protein